MALDFFDYIVQRRLKFIFCPAFLKPVEYWNYQKQEQIHRKSWRIFILLDLIVIAVAIGVFFWTSDLAIKIFSSVFFLFCLGDIIRITFSGNQRMWWIFLFSISTIFTLLLIFSAIFIHNYLILIIAFTPINHLISLLKSRKLI